MRKKIFGFLSLIAILGMVLVPAFALVHIAEAAVTPITITPTPPPDIDADHVMEILPTIINYVFGFLIAIVTLFVIISGYLFVTAGGSPDKVTTARKWLMFALVGLAVALLSRGLVALLRRIIDVE